MSVSSWLGHARRGVSNSSYGPTASHRQSVDHARSVFEPVKAQLNELVDVALPTLKREMQAAGAPWTVGQAIDGNALESN